MSEMMQNLMKCFTKVVLCFTKVVDDGCFTKMSVELGLNTCKIPLHEWSVSLPALSVNAWKFVLFAKSKFVEEPSALSLPDSLW